MLQKSSTLCVFLKNPTKKFYLMEISKLIQLAHTSVKRDLDILVKLKFVNKEVDKKGMRKFPIYFANISNDFKDKKKIYNLDILFQSKLINYLEEKLMPKSIVLFGSYSRGEDIESSDIDVFVECDRENLDLTLFEKRIGRKVQLHFNSDFKSYSNELKNNIVNGIILYGYLECFK